MSGERRLGVDLGGTKIEGVVLGPANREVERYRTPTPRDDYRGTLDAIARLVERLDPTGELPLGIGTPGSWIAARSVMQNCNSTWLNGRPLKQDLESRLDRPVRLANDADCFALSEAVDGAGAGASIVVGVILGTGVGGGIVMDGRLLAGPNGLSGEWGHTPMAGLDGSLPSRACYCGRADCVETYLSGPGLHETHLALHPEEAAPPVDAREVHDRAGNTGGGADQVRAAATLVVYCEMLAANLANLVGVIDPHVIVAGGGLSRMTEIYDTVPDRMRRHVFGDVFQTRIVPPRWGDASGVRGAAWLW
jgi:fructokinase